MQHHRDSSTSSRFPQRGTGGYLFAAVALLLLAVAVYGRVSGYGYLVTDDPKYITGNHWVRAGLTWEGVSWAFRTTYFSNWHPLTWLSLMLDTELFGADPRPRHLVNLALHWLNAVLLFAIGCRLLRAFWPALFMAALFVVHPLHAESVAWLAERKDLLCALFYFAAVLYYLSYAKRPNGTGLVVLIVLQALALMAKPMAVSLPLVLLLLDLFVVNRLDPVRLVRPRGWRQTELRAVVEKLPLLLLVAASMAITLAAQHDAMRTLQVLPLPDRFTNALISYTVYLRQLVMPVELAFFYPLVKPDVVADVLPALLLLGLVLLLAMRLRGHGLVLFGLGWFFLALVPVIGIVQVGAQAHADRYAYIPAAGVYLVVAYGLARLAPRLRVLPVLAACLVCFYAVLGWVQVGYWASSESLWARTAEVSGNSRDVRIGLFEAYLQSGKLAAAEIQARALLEEHPGNFSGYFAMGLLSGKKQEPAAAEYWFRQSLARRGDDASALFNLGNALAAQGRTAAAARSWRRALQLDPALRGARYNLMRMEQDVKQEFDAS